MFSWDKTVNLKQVFAGGLVEDFQTKCQFTSNFILITNLNFSKT